MKADKGNCFVVIDTSDYEDKVNQLLDDDKPTKKCLNLRSKELNVN